MAARKAGKSGKRLVVVDLDKKLAPSAKLETPLASRLAEPREPYRQRSSRPAVPIELRVSDPMTTLAPESAKNVWIP